MRYAACIMLSTVRERERMCSRRLWVGMCWLQVKRGRRKARSSRASLMRLGAANLCGLYRYECPDQCFAFRNIPARIAGGVVVRRTV